MKYFNGKRDFVFVKDFDVFCNKYAFNPKKNKLYLITEDPSTCILKVSIYDINSKNIY